MREKIAPEDYSAPISHDGVHDSLTYLAAPSFFYEILHREISRANREQTPLMLFRFTLLCKVNGLIGSQYELSIINFAKAITRLTRDSDVSARVGRLEFFTLLPVVTVQGLNFVDRLIQIWDSEDFEIIYSFVQYIHKESLLEFLGRLDLAESKSN